MTLPWNSETIGLLENLVSVTFESNDDDDRDDGGDINARKIRW